ncbi:MAG: tRNA adenosine(34) deaminase TadA [Pseudomonadota bacterium]
MTYEPQQEKDEYWMVQALRLAQRAREQGEVPVGALLVKDDVLIAEGWNQPITLNDPTAHAEIMCLRRAGEKQANYRLIDCTLYVTLEPCAMCTGALLHARVKRVVYATPEPKAGCIHSQAQLLDQPFVNHAVEVTSGVCEHEASQLLSGFFAQRRADKKHAKQTHSEPSTTTDDNTKRDVNEQETEKPVASPCISVCALDDDDVCAGCYRTVDEITAWNSLGNVQRREVIVKANKRCQDMWR